MKGVELTREALALAALSALGVFALVLISPAIFNDGDTFWHIRTGQWMLNHRTVLDRDVFSLPFIGRAWDAQEWLSEILMAGAFQLFGWSGVAILTGVAMAATVFCLACYLSRHLDPAPCLVVLVLAVCCVMPDLLARPHILALPFLTLWIIGLAEAAEAGLAPRWFLLPVMTIWANLHGSFILGLALAVPFAADALVAAKENRSRVLGNWCLFIAAAAGAALLNPRGLAGLLFPFVLMKVHSLASIGEWQSLDLHKYDPVELAIAATLFFIIWRGVKISVARLLVLLALIYLSLLHARYGMIFGVAGAILLAGPIGAVLKRDPARSTPLLHWKPAAAGIAICFIAGAAFRIALPIRRDDAPVAPLAAFSAVPSNLAAAPVFNNYSFGGFLIWNGIRPLVDSRADFYGDAYLNDYWRAVSGDRTTVDRLFRKYRVAWTLLKPSDPLVSELDRRPGWHRLYTGPNAVVQAGPEAANLFHVAMRAPE